ncbi:SEC14 cytosolic factor family protein / phosphoglyceride transfer family protein [Zea mays]|uniref:SEC14 cytosolic factor family protein / phosphoglyceride transfer family protein n=1 Tax=Zea mays TaxID=4577 RepID=A0A1D6L9W9_MAIZE|nr:SEC14 cytosolic factor family protein / phosphoglyceride transfer family protein [Zea mays]
MLLMAQRKSCKRTGLCYFSGSLRSKASLCLRGDFLLYSLFVTVGVFVLELRSETLCTRQKRSLYILQCFYCISEYGDISLSLIREL